MSMVLKPQKRSSTEEITLNRIGEILGKIAVGIIGLVFVGGTVWASFGVAGASPLQSDETTSSYVIKGGNTCADAVVKGLGTAEVDGAYALRYVLDQGSFGEKYLSDPITVPRLMNAGDEILITGPWLTPGENGGTVTLTRTQFDDDAKIERLATTARDVVRPTFAECNTLGEQMPDYYPENILLDQRAHQPA